MRLWCHPFQPCDKDFELGFKGSGAAGAGFVCQRAYSGHLRKEWGDFWSSYPSTLPRRGDGSLVQRGDIVSDGWEVRPTCFGD